MESNTNVPANPATLIGTIALAAISVAALAIKAISGK